MHLPRFLYTFLQFSIFHCFTLHLSLPCPCFLLPHPPTHAYPTHLGQASWAILSVCFGAALVKAQDVDRISRSKV